jgi:hypothetical protein
MSDRPPSKRNQNCGTEQIAKHRRDDLPHQHGQSLSKQSMAVAFIVFAQFAKKNPFVRFSIALTREQFDNQLPLIAERLSPAHLQQTATVYMEAFRYKVLLDNTIAKSEHLTQQQIEDASNLCLRVFRSFSDPRVFSFRSGANRRF